MINGFPEVVYKEAQRDPLDIGPNATALDLMQAIYRNPGQELYVRMRAASIAIAYESPKLIAQAVLTAGSFAELLDKAIERSNSCRLIEAQPIAEPNGGPAIKPPPEPALPNPLLRMYSPRFRRRF